MSSYRQRTTAPTVIGADLIQEARQVEKEWNDRTATQFRTDVLSALAAMEMAR